MLYCSGKGHELLSALAVFTVSARIPGFDVVSLFTAIPVEKACNYIKKKLEDDYSLHSRSNLDIDDIICVLNFVLSNNYFICDDDIYKQIHGCAMGSPVSP